MSSSSAPCLIGGIFDGIGRPLKYRDHSGVYVRGVNVDPWTQNINGS
jgi:vacuolar-type H+-ATPase catalytic subunit A/Vma1